MGIKEINQPAEVMSVARLVCEICGFSREGQEAEAQSEEKQQQHCGQPMKKEE